MKSMKFIKGIQKFGAEQVNEMVFNKDEKTFVVSVPVEIPTSLISAYTKKVKEQTGKVLSQMYAEANIAEELVKYVCTTYLDIDQLPASALVGGAAQAQPQAQAQAGAAQVQVQEPVQIQEPQAQPPVQGEPQVQPQAQPQAQGEFENVQDEPDEEELPL